MYVNNIFLFSMVNLFIKIEYFKSYNQYLKVFKLIMISFKFADDRKCFLNLDNLKKIYKNTNRLENADAFNQIFKITKKNFKNEVIDKDIFININIKSYEWISIMKFLENGIICKNLNNNENFINDLENANKVAIIFQIPSFLEYYKLHIEFIKKYNNYIDEKIFNNLQKDCQYNPMTPDEDYKKLYHWQVASDLNTHNVTSGYRLGEEYSIAALQRVMLTGEGKFYFRKLK